jgi:adenosylmethionine-8-amino-7-oxononanoate aminotransferase
MTMGKGLSGGYVPLSAVITSRRIIDPIAKGSGGFKHAQTFSHTPAMCAAGLATVRYLRRERLIERSAAMGSVLHRKLAALKDHPLVGDVRGLGLLAGVELVADKATRAAYPRAKKVAETVVAAAMDVGLVLWPNVGQADGTNGDLVMLAPPFVITEPEVDLLIARLTDALDRAALKLG